MANCANHTIPDNCPHRYVVDGQRYSAAELFVMFGTDAEREQFEYVRSRAWRPGINPGWSAEKDAIIARKGATILEY